MQVKHKGGLGLTLTALATLSLTAAPSQAQTQSTYASVTGSGPNASAAFSYSGGPSGTFSATGGSQFIGLYLPLTLVSFPDTLTFTGLQATGPASGTGAPGDPFRQPLSGGTFSLTNGPTTLLSGSFTGGDILSAENGSSTASITNTLNNVTYTGGTYFALSGLNNPGSFSISLTSSNPVAGTTGGYLNGFTAGGSATFSAATNVVPESSGLANMSGALLAMGLSGLVMVVKGKKAKKGKKTLA